MRRRNHAIVGDLLALPISIDFPYSLQVEVGSHSALSTFASLGEHPLPGFRPLAVLYRYPIKNGVKAKRSTGRYYVDPVTSFTFLADALEEIRIRP